LVFVLKTWREVSSKRREVIGFVMIFAAEEAGAVLILAVKLLSIKKKKKKQNQNCMEDGVVTTRCSMSTEEGMS